MDDSIFTIWNIIVQPVNVNASFGKHQEPQVHVSLTSSEYSNCVVDQHAAMRQPESGKYCDNSN